MDGSTETSGSRPNKNFQIRRANTADKARLNALLEAAYDQRYTNTFWHWKYEASPLGPAVIWLAEQEGQIIGMRPVLPVRLRTPLGDIGASLYVDVCTHPDHRRKGVFTALVKQANQGCADHGQAVSFTFPNANSFPGYRRFQDWLHLLSLPLLVKPLDISAALRRKVGNIPGALVSSVIRPMLALLFRSQTPGTRYLVEAVTTFSPAIDRWLEGAPPRDKIKVVRQHHYLNWRYSAHPEQVYLKLVARKGTYTVGYLVATVMEKFGLPLGFIADLAVADGHVEALPQLIIEMEQMFRRQEVAAVGCVLSKDNIYYDALLKSGFRVLPQGFVSKEFNCMLHVNDSQKDHPLFHQPDNWFLIWGDWDSV